MSYQSEVLTDSPILYWRLEETSGTNAADTSGNSRPGTYFTSPTLGATSLVPSQPSDKATSFNGANQSVFRSSETALNPTSFTTECWFKISGSPGSNGYHAVMAKDNYSSGGGSRGWSILVDTAGSLYMYGRRANGTFFDITTAAGTIVTGTVYHVAATYDGTTARLYLNGTEVANHAPGGTSNLYASTHALQIGKDSQGSGRSTNGTIDEFAFYGTALSGTRIAAHYSAGAAAGTTVNAGLVAEATTVLAGSTSVGVVRTGGLVAEATSVLSGSVTVGQVVAGGLVTETTTVLAGFATEGIIRYAGLVSESTAVLPGVTSAGVLVEGGLVSETTTLFAGSVIDGEQFDGGFVTETTTVLGGTVELGYATTYRDVTNGRIRYGVGYASWAPAVVPTPPHLSGVGGGAGYARAVDKALAFSAVTVVGTQPTFTVSELAEPRHRDRVIVGGRDVTYFRGAEVRVGNYQLMEPFGYGTAVLEFPQVYPEYEAIGVGDLAWLAPGSPVLIQRVDAAGNVVATDYKGVLTSPNANTGTFTYEVGGEVTGPASLRHRPMPLFRVVEDIGRQLARALGFVGVRTPRLGPDTGIELARVGDMSLLEYMQQLVGRAWTRSGNQWTVMPDDQGVYRIARKDRATIAGTVYLSASSAEADLRRDIAEEPNRIFGTGVTPAGKRIRNGRYPGLDIDNADKPAFPGSMSEGDTGDGVLALIRQLQVQGYLNAETAPGGFDEDVTEAVRQIQEDAGLTVTGTVNSATWDAIYDNASQGVSLKLARVEPLAQKGYTKQYRYSASGAIIGRNPNYDPTRLKIDRMVDYGTGFKKSQMVEWSRAELVEAAEPNWVGTLTIHSGAVVAGEHTPGDPIGGVLVARDIKPGMNLSLPQFQGGIVVHVTAAQVTGDVVTLQVDTRARDAWNVAQVIERNRESRRDPARAFFRQLASSQAQKDAIEEWSEVGGLIADHDLVAGWNVIEVVGGQAGTVRSIRFNTNPNAESSVAVFGKKVWPKALQQAIGNPLTAEGAARWQDEQVRNRLERDHGLLYSAGDDTDPGGYSPGYKSGESSIFTGRFEDDASFAYYTDTRPILYVAVYVDRDTTIPGGRILWPQLEAGA